MAWMEEPLTALHVLSGVTAVIADRDQSMTTPSFARGNLHSLQKRQLPFQKHHMYS